MRLIGLVLALLTLAPLAAEAQQAGTGYRIGMLETRSTTLNAANIDAFGRGCWNLARDERFRDPARDLILLKMDLDSRGTAQTAAGIPQSHNGTERPGAGPR